MGHPLLDAMKTRLISGLKRASYKDCSQWSCDNRIMGKPYPGPWSFYHHPWLKQMHDDTNPQIVGQKSAQMGYTEWLLNSTFYEIDINRQNVLYLMPTEDDAAKFSAGRFDPALEASTYLANMFSDVRNVGHKRAGTCNLYVRGAKSRSKLKSLPVSMICMDEMDEMNPAMVALAEERVAGQIEKYIRKISTPKTHNDGINYEYNRSTQNHYYFPCPSCGRWIELKFPESIDLESETLICYQCKNQLHHEAKPEFLGKGRWEASYSDREVIGYYINQLYSCSITSKEFCQKYRKSLDNKFNEQEFHNSNLGLPFEADGSRIGAGDIKDCTRDRRMGQLPTSESILTIGIDVGAKINYEVCAFTPNGRNDGDINTNYDPHTVEVGEFQNLATSFEQVDKVIERYRPHSGIIDANPERRASLELCNRWHGIMKMCFYSDGMGRTIHEHNDEPSVTVDRTAWMDITLGRFSNKSINLPFDLPKFYTTQMQAPVRIYEKDKNGNPTARFREGRVPDHQFHAHTYCEVALGVYDDSEVYNITSL